MMKALQNLLIFTILLEFDLSLSKCVKQLKVESKWRSSLNTEKYEVSKIDLSIKKTKHVAAPYQVHLFFLNETFNLTLQKLESSVLSRDFTFKGQFWDEKKLKDLQRSTYVDPENKAVLRIKEDQGEFAVEGFLNGLGIRHENCEHIGVRRKIIEPARPKIHPDRPFPSRETSTKKSDYNSTSTLRVKRSKTGYVEVRVIVDRALGDAVGGQDDDIIAYTVVAIEAANLIFDSLDKPKIKLRLIGVGILSEEEDIRVIQNTDGMVYPVLAVFRQISSAQSGKEAVVILITGTQLSEQEDDGTISQNVLGATVSDHGDPGACDPENNMSVVKDEGGVFETVQLIAHHIGHALDAADDFATECDWDYVMGYYGHGTETSFQFSECSQKDIRKFVKTTAADCLFDKPEKELSEIDVYPGQLIPLARQCEAYLESNGCIPKKLEATAVTNCLKFNCPILEGTVCSIDPEDDSEDSPPRPFISILDGTPCVGKDDDYERRCIRGKCVKSKDD